VTENATSRVRGGAVTAMIVDDSAFFRKRLVSMIERDGRIRVIAQAENGAQAVTLAGTRRPAVIVMDVNMPIMDGITAVRQIMARNPTPILMFSSLTHEGARESLDAIEAGAVDFMPKQMEGDTSHEQLARNLCDRLVALAGERVAKRAGAARPVPAPRAAESVPVPRGVGLVLIGSSTGGPIALQGIVAALPANYPVPVVVAQHMPDRFTAEFAKRLDSTARVRVLEAADGTPLSPGTVYIARGGMQTELVDRARYGTLAVRAPQSGEIYQPSVDVLFRSAASFAGRQALALILTGMGADGCEGARALKAAGARVWSQDEATSVVYGMPQAVARAGLTDQVLALEAIGPALARVTGRA